MNTTKIVDEKYVLETIIDKTSLKHVLELIAEICSEKADHIQSSYATDSKTDPIARLWDKCAVRVDELSINSLIQKVSK